MKAMILNCVLFGLAAISTQGCCAYELCHSNLDDSSIGLAQPRLFLNQSGTPFTLQLIGAGLFLAGLAGLAVAFLGGGASLFDGISSSVYTNRNDFNNNYGYTGEYYDQYGR